MEAVIEHARELHRRMPRRQIGPSNIANEQRVSGKHSPGRNRLLLVSDYQADAFRSVAGSLEHANRCLAKLQLEAIADWHMLELGSGLRAHVDLCAGACRELLVPRDEIGMKM